MDLFVKQIHTPEKLYCLLMDLNLAWYQQLFNPILLRPSLWRFTRIFKRIEKYYAKDFLVLDALAPGTLEQKIQRLSKELENVINPATFCVLFCWLFPYCKGTTLGETKVKSWIVAQFLSNLKLQ
ncbi:LH2 [Bovine adenovirus 7]|nr:LH2 [Bovine adenovirus 7]URN46023.1 LH2 [Bovine adenovirus 7]